jgi:hypothetical protein
MFFECSWLNVVDVSVYVGNWLEGSGMVSRWGMLRAGRFTKCMLPAGRFMKCMIFLPDPGVARWVWMMLCASYWYISIVRVLSAVE